MNSPDSDMERESGCEAAAATTAAVPLSGSVDAAEGDNSGDPLLDVMERWDECYRRGGEVAAESLGITDPVLFAELRERIDQQKRLYERLKLRDARTDRAAGLDESSPMIPGHEILGKVGQGGMGTVYKARDVKLGRVVAIKTIAEGPFATAEQRDRFRSEAQAIARLGHPNIIGIHAVDEHDNSPYLSLEFAEGGSLARRLDEGPMAPREAAGLVETLARAVHIAHLAGIVHRDLKPSNVLLTADGIPKVSDFGLAKLLGDDSARTLSGQPLGTPSYMAPEQAEGRSKDVGPVADVYALGAILYQALTGRPPFLGHSAIETIKLVTSTEAVPPRRLRPDVPRDLETICLRCLEKEPRKRYATSIGLADDLRRFLDDRPITARPVNSLERSWRWCRRNPRLAAVSATLAATVLIATSVVMGLAYRHNGQLRAEVKRTEANAAKARRHYQEARSAITEILKQLDDRRLTGSPRLLEVRGAVRAGALAFYDRVLSEVDSTDPVVRADTVRTLDEACILQHMLGRHDQALESARRSLRLADGLMSERPDNLEYLELKVDCLTKLAVLLDVSKHPDDVLDACHESVVMADRLAKALPDDPAQRERLAMCETIYGNSLWVLKRAREAMGHYQEATRIRKGIDPSKLPGVTLRLAESLMNEGMILWGQDHSQAVDRFRDAEQALLSIPADHRDDGGNAVISFARIYVNWGGVLNDMRCFEDAVSRSDAGLAMVESYLQGEPSDWEARTATMYLHGNRANAYAALGRHRESAGDWARLVELSPQPVLPGHRINWAIELFKSGDIAGGAAQVKLVKPAEVVTGEDRYNLGAYFALSAAAAKKGTSVAPDQQGVVDSRIKDALRWLELAAQTGLFNDPTHREEAIKDQNLAILRDDPDFRRLIEPTKTKR